MTKTRRFSCPCCGFLTLREPPPGGYDICAVCYWEDSIPGPLAPDRPGGANQVSLREAQRNFILTGVAMPGWRRYVRAPRPEEVPVWKINLEQAKDIVQLDGPERRTNYWPLSLALWLLDTPEPWLNEKNETEKTHAMEFRLLATYVNGYARYEPGQLTRPLEDAEFEQHCSRYTTQELLDSLFIALHTEYSSETRLREILQEVVRRYRSETPPTFIAQGLPASVTPTDDPEAHTPPHSK